MESAARLSPSPTRDGEASVTDDAVLLKRLSGIVGRSHVLTGMESTRRFCTGFRFGHGSVVAVVRPGTLVEQWRVLKACAAANKIVIMQAANTGLTGGSTPDGNDYDRGIVLINTMRITGIHLVNEGKQVVCLPGTTLYQLEDRLRPLGRDPHSVIGSSCIGASVFGGICNNSGGALIHRGPAFTQLALFARLDEAGDVHLVNHLGINLGNDPEAMLERLEKGAFTEADVANDPNRLASDHDYATHVREIEAPTAARFNADPHRLFEASGSAGKVMLMAVRLDTFAKTARTGAFYIGSNDPSELETIRRHILANFKSLPISGEYLHRTAFDIAEKYGKDTFLAIHYLGTAWLPLLFAIKGRFDGICERLSFLPSHLSDRIMQFASSLFPRHLPKRMMEYRDRFEHHLILQMGDDGIEEAAQYLKSIFPSENGDFFTCTDDEGAKAMLHRFAAAGAAVRYRAVHGREVEDIVALDVALRRNDEQWRESLPPDIDAKLLHKLYYGHFFCHVFHQDYIVAKGHDCPAIEEQMWKLLDQRGAEYPAEHNVGHLYHAKPALVEHYKALDPCNAFNPGIGRTTKCLHWKTGLDTRPAAAPKISASWTS
ncbi:D-lactate dehydrogenase [Bradyrhizobium neotropicale]|uniref:D-lactate dehydrogenase n=1 Tax=Bradyrhizobium neotropicale TaxID=1497615 RepID=UPI001AD657EB|nr:D-lactate dehydrogenase [Bradyrhizobium neotropicale]MBO4222046.1 D-lactate dehydrogenase [Bradyrhizobium neotropicale]